MAKISRHDFCGACFDSLQVLGRKGAIERKVVIKAVFQSWADSQLCRWEKFFDGLCHDMGAAVTVHLTSLCAVEPQRLDDRTSRQRPRQIHNRSVHFGCQNILGLRLLILIERHLPSLLSECHCLDRL